LPTDSRGYLIAAERFGRWRGIGMKGLDEMFDHRFSARLARMELDVKALFPAASD